MFHCFFIFSLKNLKLLKQFLLFEINIWKVLTISDFTTCKPALIRVLVGLWLGYYYYFITSVEKVTLEM